MTCVVQEVTQQRPWLSLYGVRLRPRPKVLTEEEEADLALIQRVFTDEVMHTILSYLGPYTLGLIACVCQQWRQFAEHSRHWEAASQHAFGACHKDVHCCSEHVRQVFRGSWKRMFLESPHLRFEGLYVSRNTYIRQGVSEWKREKTCHLVTYFRYFRFFPDGTLLYRTSPHTVGKVAKSLVVNPCQHGTRAAHKYEQHVHSGRYVIKGGKVYLIIVYPNSRNTEVRARCAIRGVPQLGAANRLDLEELASFDRETGSSASMLGSSDPDADPAGAGSVTNYRRGLNPCVFVPWEGVATSVLNLPVKDMDFWMPG